MKRMGMMAKRFVALAMSVALASGMPGSSVKVLAAKDADSTSAASAVTRSSIHDGTILHAFCWNFNTIREKMPQIAAAGYTAVQTSPINECLQIHSGGALYGETEDEGRWYYHYQPTDWTIGNYQLGTRDEFKAMCEEADKYGIGVIVDIDPNHTTPLYDQVSDNLKNAAGGERALYHIGSMVGNDEDHGMQYNNRISVTYDAMGGLPDVDTENAGFQRYFFEFLQDCIDCGADGFRVDTAKHIALPDDKVPDTYWGQDGRNNFYPNMKSAIDSYGSKSYADLFVYGEVLDGDAARLAAYQDMLGGSVASNYGGAIRNAVSSGNVSVKKLMNYKISDDTSTGKTYKADEDKLVTWVESHDNYINDHSYNEVDDREVVLGWSIIAARAAGTPLFFSRPDGSSAENPWGKNRIGEAGSDIFMAPEVVAVNKFRTKMEGENEYLRNPGNNASVLMIERGTKGVVIVNASENEFALDSETNLGVGTYRDSVEGRDSIYTVEDGKIYGTVPAKSVVVLDTLTDGDYSTLFFHNTDNWSSVRAVVAGNSYTCDPVENAWFKVTIPEKDFKVVFTDGVNKSAEFTITETSGRFMTAASSNIYQSKAEAEEAMGIITKTVYFLNTEEWKTVYAYAWNENTQFFGGWPGVAISNEEGYWWRADVKMVQDTDFSIIFNDGNGSQTVDINMSDMSNNVIAISADQSGKNLAVDKYSSKAAAEEATGIGADSITVYYYNACNWNTVGVYTWGDADLGSWPGTQCEYDGDGWWKKTINASPSSNLNIIFNNFSQDDNNKHQTEDMKADSLKKLYFIGSKYKYSSKAAALEALAKDNLKLEKNLNPNQSPASDEGNAQKFVKPVQAEEAAKDGYTKVYIKLDVEKYPEDANVYIWTDGANDEAASGWPGTPMTHIGNGWHSVNLPNRVIATEDAEITDANENKEATDETLDVQTDESANKDEEVIKDDVLNDSVDSEQKSENEAKDVEEQSDAEEESEESSGVLDEVKDFFQELIQGVVAFFNPMPKVMAAEYHTFATGVHVIINNGDGFQEDDVNPRFTTVRPSAQELNQDAEAKDNKAADENAETGTEEAKPEVKEPVASTETTPVASQPSKGSSSSSSVVSYTKASVVPTPNGDEAAKVEETPKADTVTQVASTQTSKKKSNSGLRKSEDNKKSAMAETNTEAQETEDTKDTEEAPKEEVKVADANVDTKDKNTEVTVEDEPVPEGINDNDTKATFPIAPVLAVAFLCVVGAAVLIKKNAKAE